MVFLEENIAYTRNVVENSWDIIHPDIARFLLEWKVKTQARLITAGEERIYARIKTELGRLVPNTRGLKPVNRWNKIAIYNCKDLEIPGQRLNGRILLNPQIKQKWTGKMLQFGWKRDKLVYPEIVSYTESVEPVTDVNAQVEIVFPSDAPSGKYKSLKFEEFEEIIKNKNRALIEQLITQS